MFKIKKTHIMWLSLLAALVAALWVALFFEKAPIEKPENGLGSLLKPPAAALSNAPETSPSAPASVHSEAKPVPPEEALKSFKTLVGEDLQFTVLDNTLLLAARGRPGQGKRVGGRFNLDEHSMVVARAQEVIEAARQPLGVPSDAPLNYTQLVGDAVSAKVFFHQQKDGVGIYPGGGVSVILGSGGELLGLDSNVVRKLQIENALPAALALEQARIKAIAAVKDQSSALKAEGGQLVLWILEPQAGLARYAYNFNVQGHQVIVDATDGRVLFVRDMRISSFGSALVVVGVVARATAAARAVCFAGADLQRSVERAETKHSGQQWNDAQQSPEALISQAGSKNGNSGNDSKSLIGLADIGFYHKFSHEFLMDEGQMS